MSSVILHIIAAVLWVIALVIMQSAGELKERGRQDGKIAGLILSGSIGVIAFTLQVIA